MALTEEQEYAIKAAIINLTEGIGGLLVAKNTVPEPNDLELMDQLNSDKYDEFQVEIDKREGEYKFLKGRFVTTAEELTSSDIDDAAEGTGVLFPLEVGPDPYVLIRPHIVDGLIGGTGQITASIPDLSGGSGETNVAGDEFTVTGVDWSALGAVATGTINISGSPYTIDGISGDTLTISPVAGSGLTGLLWTLPQPDVSSDEDTQVAAEIAALNFFTFPAPAGDTQAALLYQLEVNKFAAALDQEAIDIAGETAAWGGDVAFDPTQNNAALSDLSTFKAAMDLNSDTFITMADFLHASAPTTMPALIAARLAFLTGTRQPYITGRETALNTDLGTLSALVTEETVTGTGLWRDRYDYLNFRVNRSNGTYTEITNQVNNDQALDDLIAFKQSQIEQYELLLP